MHDGQLQTAAVPRNLDRNSRLGRHIVDRADTN
jgi:hypothetical protein